MHEPVTITSLLQNPWLTYSSTFVLGMMYSSAFWRRTSPVLFAAFYFMILAIYYSVLR
jgi:hypothetical protein